MTDTDPTVAAAYDRWARLYALAARRTPGVARLRRLAVDELALSPGDTVVDMGCGPGVNLPLLRSAVGPSGRLIGLDVAPGMLERAGAVDGDTALVRGDATRPPIDGPVDGLLATFVVTLFDDPEAVIDRWWSMLAPDGALAILNLAPMRGLAGTVANPLLSAGLTVSTPTSDRFDEPLVDVLDDRVAAAHGALDARADRLRYVDSADGLLRVAVGHCQA